MLIKSKLLNNNFHKCIKTLLDTCQLSYFSNTNLILKLGLSRNQLKNNVLFSVA